MAGSSRKLIAKRWVPILTKLYKHDASHITKRLQCFACGRTGILDRAHIIPKHKGGSDKLSNLHLLCRSCHAESDFFYGKRYWRWFRFQIRTAFARRIQLSIAIGEMDCDHSHDELKRMHQAGRKHGKRTGKPRTGNHKKGGIAVSQQALQDMERYRPIFEKAISEGYVSGRMLARYLNDNQILSPRCNKWIHQTANRMKQKLGL